MLRQYRNPRLLYFAFDGCQKRLNYHNFSARMLLIFSRACLVLAVAAAILALAGPAQLRTHTVTAKAQADLIFVLDLSPSMAVVDHLGQSRLDAARTEITRFLELKLNLAIGLVGFGSEAALLVPPSADYQSLQRTLERLQVSLLGEGTAIGVGLAIAANHLRTAGSRSVVLISDGGNNSGAIQPEIAFRLLRQQGIKLYIIALQNPPSGEVLLRDPKTGQLYQARLHTPQGWEELRSMLIREKIGRFFPVGSQEELSASLREIESYEDTQSFPRQELSRVAIHSRFLLSALLLVVVGWISPKLLLREIS